VLRKSCLLCTNLPSKPSVPKQQWEQRKGSQEPNKAKMIPKQPLASPKPQV